MGDEHPWERPLGAWPIGGDEVRFRVWAPAAERVAVAVGNQEHLLSACGWGCL